MLTFVLLLAGLAHSRNGRPNSEAKPMTPLIYFFAVVLLCGCSPSNGSTPVKPASKAAGDTAPTPSAFRWDKPKNVIWLDARVPPKQRQTFPIAQGSITIETLSVADNKLTFLYTPEIEGGYTVYECLAPVSSEPIAFRIARNGTPGALSFNLRKCKVIRSGNVFFKPAPESK